MNKTGLFEIAFNNDIERSKFIGLYKDLIVGRFWKSDNTTLHVRLKWSDFYKIKEALGLRKEVVILEKWADRYEPKIHTKSKTRYVMA